MADTVLHNGGEATISTRKHCLFLLFSNKGYVSVNVGRGGNRTLSLPISRHRSAALLAGDFESNKQIGTLQDIYGASA